MADGRVSGGCNSPAQKWNLQSAIHQSIPHSHSSRLCPLSPGVRLKETTAHQPPQPGWEPPNPPAPCQPRHPHPGPSGIHLFFSSPPIPAEAFRCRPSVMLSRTHSRRLLPPHTLSQPTDDCVLCFGDPIACWGGGNSESPSGGRVFQATGGCNPGQTFTRTPFSTVSSKHLTLQFPAGKGCREQLRCHL